jgi:signal transduction histidine kinase
VAISWARFGNERDDLVLTLHDITEVKRITDELGQKNEEIQRSSLELQRAIDEISALIERVTEKQDFGVNFEYDFSEKCYDSLACTQTDCPCHGKEAGSCWNEVGTFGEGQVLCDYARKMGSCSQCSYFKRMAAMPINLIGEQFNNMMYILSVKNTEVKEALSELKQTQSHLLQQEKMASIGQLAAGVAHEINNPVGFISSNLGSLSKYSARLAEYIALEDELVSLAGSQELSDRQAEGKKKYKIEFVLSDIDDLVRESLDGCDRVKKIVQDLKSFSRVDQATRQTVDIHECLDSTINIIWNELKYKAKIDRKYEATVPIACFPQQLNQVFMNLLINASHAIDKEGVITIKTWQDEEALFVAISDTGSGIAPENVGRIFEPFFTTKDVGKGTGLGLSIVYDIVTKNHHGDILVDSTLGQGTTFTVKIPCGEV